MIQPGLFAGCTLVLIWSFTDLGTPLMFGYYTITPVQVFEQITEVSANPAPLRAGCRTAPGLHGPLPRRQSHPRPRLRRLHHQGLDRLRHNPLRGLAGLAAAAMFLTVFALAVTPHLSVILTSISATGAWYKSILPAHFTLDHYRQALADPLALPSVKHSLQYATCATLIALIVGFAAALDDRPQHHCAAAG